LPAGAGTSAPAAQTLAAPAAASPVPPERGEFVRERFKATQEWLQNTPNDRYAIQLVTVNSGELRKLEDFLLRASAMVPAGELLVYSVKIDGRQHYRVAYGSYASPEQALDAIKELPPLFSAYHPYYRSVGRMRSQNRQ
jgi:septal ring-binding cell division protein DamX